MAGNVERAAALLEEEVGRNPEHDRAHFNLGTLYMELGRFRDARQAFGAARELYRESDSRPSEENPFPKYHAATGNLASMCLLVDDLAAVPALIEESTVPGFDGAQPQQLEVHLTRAPGGPRGGAGGARPLRR